MAFVRLLALLLLLDLASFQIRGSEEVPIHTIDVHETKRLIEADHVYLDVRTADEFYQGHVKGSINVPYLFFTENGRVKNPKFLEQVSAVLKKHEFIVVGCLSGVRSLAAAKVLVDEGFHHVKNFGGGYQAWESNGFTIVRRPRSEL